MPPSMLPLSAVRLRLLITALLVVSLLGALDHTVVATSLATIAGSLGAPAQLSWIVVAYTLASTVLLPVIGKLGDVFGTRPVFLASVAAFLLASLACGFAESMTQLVIARAVQGMSSAGVQLMSQAIVAGVATPRQRPRLLSIVGAAFPVAILVGPVIGGLVTDHLGWRWIFWMNIPLGVAALVLAMVSIPALPAPPRRRFDIAGSLVLAVTFVALVALVTWLGLPGYAVPAAVAGVLVAGGAALFVRVETRVPEPVIPLALFRDRTVAAGMALSAIIGVGLFSVVSFIPTYVQLAYRTSATTSGLVPIATVFGMLASSLLIGHRVSRTGRYRRYPLLGTALGAAGMLAMAVLPAGLPLAVPMTVMGCVGIGTGAFMNLLVAVVQNAAPPDRTGVVTSTVMLVRQLGATVGTALIGGVIGFGVAAGLPASLDPSAVTPEIVRAAPPVVQDQVAQLYTDVMAPVFAGLAVIYLLGVVAAAAMPAGRLTDEQPAAPAA